MTTEDAMAKKQTRKSISLNHEQYVRVAVEADAMGIPMAKLAEIGIDLVLAMPHDEIVAMHREHQARMDAKRGVWRGDPAAKIATATAIMDQHPRRPGRPAQHEMSAADRALAAARAARETTALTMRAEGKSMSAISLKLDVSRARVYQLLRECYVITQADAQRELDARAAVSLYIEEHKGHDEKIVEMVHPQPTTNCSHCGTSTPPGPLGLTLHRDDCPDLIETEPTNDVAVHSAREPA